MNGAGGPMGMNMNGGMGMNPMMQAQMQQGRVSYQPPDAARRGLCRDYHSELCLIILPQDFKRRGYLLLSQSLVRRFYTVRQSFWLRDRLVSTVFR